MRKNLLVILSNLQQTVTIYAQKNNIPKINYPSIYPYKNETTVTDKQIYNDIFALNSFLRHPHFYYMSRVTDGMPSKIEHHEYK